MHRGGIGNGNGSDKASGIEGLHLSFSPASSSSSWEVWDVSSLKVHSVSGTVPFLQPDECVSIMASVDITGLRWSGGGGSSKESDGRLQLAINALWKDGRAIAAQTDRKKQGCVLGLLQLQYESLLLSSPQDTLAGFTHQIDFNNFNGLDSLHQTKSGGPMPKAIFEYRNPRVITVDVSQCLGGADGGGLRDMVGSLNAALIGSGGRNRIELCCLSSDGGHHHQHPRIIILSQTPEERLGMVKLVTKNLPDSARVVGTTSGGEVDQDAEEKKAMIALLHCMAQEVKLLDSHRCMASEDMRLSTVAGLAAAQAKTDEVASRIRRGWECYLG